MAQMKKYVKGEKQPRGIVDIDTEKMTGIVRHVTQLGEGPETKVWLEHKFDLSKTDMKEVLYHAVSDMVIKKRNKAFKSFTESELRKKIEDSENEFVFRPEDYPAERANGISDEEKMERLLKKRSPEQKIAWLVAKGIPQKQAKELVQTGNI